jgi:hypothetical protein
LGWVGLAKEGYQYFGVGEKMPKKGYILRHLQLTCFVVVCLSAEEPFVFNERTQGNKKIKTQLQNA